MTRRLGRSRYRIYSFPLFETQKQWAAALLKEDQTKWNDWEKKFVKDMGVQLSFGHDILTEEQVYRLEQLYAKYTD